MSPPSPLSMCAQSRYAFRIRIENSPKDDHPNCVDNYGIFKLVHNTSMRAYIFLGNLSMLGNAQLKLEENAMVGTWYADGHICYSFIMHFKRHSCC